MRFVLILLRYVCPRALISKACFAFKIDKEKCSPKGFLSLQPEESLSSPAREGSNFGRNLNKSAVGFYLNLDRENLV